METTSQDPQGRKAVRSPELRALETAEWPGNVRPLAHAVEAATIRCTGSGYEHVCSPRSGPAPARTPPAAPAARTPAALEVLRFQEATRRFQLDLLRRTFERSTATSWRLRVVSS